MPIAHQDGDRAKPSGPSVDAGVPTSVGTLSLRGTGPIDLAVLSQGTGPAVVLIHGLGQNVHDWPVAFVDALAGDGLRTVRFDNRDVGASTRLDGAGDPPLLRLWLSSILGIAPLADPAYTLADMANDVAGLIGRLALGPVHIVGVSMGGMIAQHLAASHPDKGRSLTSIMSSSGARGLPSMQRDVARLLRQHAPTSEEASIGQALAFRRLVAGSLTPRDEAELAARVRRSVPYGWPPGAGAARQFAAILADRDRPDLLARIACPTLVIHGADDPFVRPEHGMDTAARIPGARLFVIERMGHELTTTHVPRIARLIAEHVRAAGQPPVHGPTDQPTSAA